jgi:hypothetical protein
LPLLVDEKAPGFPKGCGATHPLGPAEGEDRQAKKNEIRARGERKPQHSETVRSSTESPTTMTSAIRTDIANDQRAA